MHRRTQVVVCVNGRCSADKSFDSFVYIVERVHTHTHVGTLSYFLFFSLQVLGEIKTQLLKNTMSNYVCCKSCWLCVCVCFMGGCTCMHTGMNGHSHLYVLSGCKVLAAKALRTRAERQYSLCSGLGWESAGEEDVDMTNASKVTFLKANADHQVVRRRCWIPHSLHPPLPRLTDGCFSEV